MNNSMWLLFLSFTCSATASAQKQTDACILDTAKDSQMITVHGKTIQEPHDLGFDVVGCNDLVILAYAGDRDNDVSANQLRQDENLKLFQKYSSATYKSKGKNICLQCMKYGDVEATLTGRLEVAAIPPNATKDQLGFLRDASGKVVGKAGWGHPVPFAKYRLVIESVSGVTARKLPKPSAKPTSTTRETVGRSRTTATPTPTTALPRSSL